MTGKPTSSIWKLKPYLKPYLGLLVLGILLAIPLSALRFSPAPLVKHFVDDLLISKDRSKLILLPAFVIGIYVINFGVRFAHYYILRFVITRVNQALKNDLFSHILNLSADYFTQKSSGALISRVSSDPQLVDQGLAAINPAVREPLTFIFLLIYTFTLNWRLTLVVFLIFPALAWVFSATGKNMKRYTTQMADANALNFSVLQEALSGIRVIKTFRLEKFVRKQFRDTTKKFSKSVMKSAAVEEASHPAVELLTAIAIALVLYFGGSQVLLGEMTSGDLISFFIAFALMTDPIRKMNDLNMRIRQTQAACDRIFEVLSWQPRQHQALQPQRIERFLNQIEFDQVEFAYPDAPEHKVLNGVSFKLERGKTLALVGRSGSGKSSLAQLLPRLFDVTSGVIKIDGVKIQELDLKDLRNLISVVSQDVFLFNDTIEENIRCGKLSASKEEIEAAARKAHALDFVLNKPEGFQTVIGDRGQKLSGGERQRLSIARAFLRDSPILILDEATSNLDSASERAVQEALSELMQHRTTLVIAHRLSTVRNADEILVLSGGQIVERGTHDQLLKADGAYAALTRI